MADTSTPHGAPFRALLYDKWRAGDFLHDHLPASVTGPFPNAMPEIMKGSFVDELLAGSQSDVPMEVRLASGDGAGEGDGAFVHLLAGHKSAPDPGLSLRLAS